MKIVTNNHIRFIDDSYKMTQGDVIGLEEVHHGNGMPGRLNSTRLPGRLHFEKIQLGLADEMDQV